MTTKQQITAALGPARDGVADLEAKLAELDNELAAAQPAEPADAFREYLTDSAFLHAEKRPLATIQSQRDKVSQALRGGRQRVSNLEHQLQEVQRAEERERIANMTMDDAATYALSELAGIEPARISAEFDALEHRMVIVDQQRSKVGPAYIEAKRIRDALWLCYGGRSEWPAGEKAKYEQARADEARLLADLQGTRYSAQEIESAHRHVRERVRGEISKAFVHVRRLLAKHAQAVERQAKVFAAMVATMEQGRIFDLKASEIHAIAEADLRTIAAAGAKVEMILEALDRPVLEARQNSEFMTIGRADGSYLATAIV